jgi:hypothetical protein
VKAGDIRPRTIPGTATFLTSRGEFEHQRFAMIPGWLYALSIGALILRHQRPDRVRPAH